MDSHPIQLTVKHNREVASDTFALGHVKGGTGLDLKGVRVPPGQDSKADITSVIFWDALSLDVGCLAYNRYGGRTETLIPPPAGLSAESGGWEVTHEGSEMQKGIPHRTKW